MTPASGGAGIERSSFDTVQSLVDSLHAWLDRHLDEPWSRTARRLPVGSDAREKFLRRWQRRLAQHGWGAISWPREYGGQGVTSTMQAAFEEVMAIREAPPQVSRAGLGMVGHVIVKLGTPAQRRALLPPMLTGDELWCLGLSEPEAGSDLTGVKTTARREGDTFVVSGTKIWTTGAATAERCFLLTRTSRGDDRHDGLTTFQVDMSLPGISVHPIRQMNGAAAYAEVVFDGVTVSADAVLGEVDRGWRTLTAHLEHERGFVASMAFRLPLLVEQVARMRAERSAVLSAPEAAAFDQRLAELQLRAVAVVALYRRTLHTQSTAAPYGGSESMTKLLCSELNRDIFEFAMELVGPEAGTTTQSAYVDTHLAYEYLTSYHLTIAGGTSEIQRNRIAESMLGLPKDVKY